MYVKEHSEHFAAVNSLEAVSDVYFISAAADNRMIFRRDGEILYDQQVLPDISLLSASKCQLLGLRRLNNFSVITFHNYQRGAKS